MRRGGRRGFPGDGRGVKKLIRISNSTYLLVGFSALTAFRSEFVSAGGSPDPGAAPVSVFTDGQHSGSERPFKRIDLDWTGGVSPLYPDLLFAGLDLSQFPITGSGSLADQVEEFRSAVAGRVQFILAAAIGEEILVQVAGQDPAPAAAVIRITQASSPKSSSGVGEAEYDPCDTTYGDEAVVYGETIRVMSLDRSLTLDQWVNVFANACAHESAHTLGFDHVARPSESDFRQPVELMLEAHTLDELRRPQEVTVRQDRCPAHAEKERSAALLQAFEPRSRRGGTALAMPQGRRWCTFAHGPLEPQSASNHTSAGPPRE